VRLLETHNFLVHFAIVVFGHSRFLGETLLQNTDLLPSFLREKNLDRSFSQEEFHESLARFRARSLESDVSLILARFKRREYVRIMLRDVLKIAPLGETTAEISALADVLIEEALREADSQLQRRHGTPQHLDAAGRLVDTPFAVLALGKLGGNELNYSSDVDLLYLYGDGEEPPRTQVTNREYFIRLAQNTTEILSRLTREGPVFRIDLRLRPQGGEGELALRLSQMLTYYAETAHDWERQALIKLKHSAGDPALAREFIRAVQSHIYTERVNFAAIKTALVAREKMQQGAPRTKSEPTINVKSDRGGIRDIEFLVQCLQRVYGGAEPWLRSGGTLFSLQKLHDKGHITGKEFHELTNAYEFLRKVEHRLQLRDGQQTHRLPDSQKDLNVLYRMFLMDLSTRISSDSRSTGSRENALLGNDGRRTDRQTQDDERGSAVMLELLRERMAAVAEIHERVIYHQQIHHQQLHQAGDDSEFHLRSRVEDSGPEQPYEHLLQRLAEDCPPIYAMAMRSDLDPVTRRNLYRFCSAAFTSSQRFAALVRSPDAIARAVTLLGTSDFLSDILIRHPEEISTLATSGNTPHPPSPAGVETPNTGDRGQLRSDSNIGRSETSAMGVGRPTAIHCLTIHIHMRCGRVTISR